MDIAILLIRVGVGATLAAHGAQKLFGWFGGHGIAGTAGFLESLGFRPARAYAWLLGAAELLGGLALGVGLMTPVAATVVAAVMVGAILAVHRDKGFFAQAGGYEYPLALALAAVATAFAGAGRYSLDHVFGWSLAGAEWGVAAVPRPRAATTAAVASRNLRLRPWRRHHPART
jgi:putative oxidoreductase